MGYWHFETAQASASLDLMHEVLQHCEALAWPPHILGHLIVQAFDESFKELAKHLATNTKYVR